MAESFLPNSARFGAPQQESTNHPTRNNDEHAVVRGPSIDRLWVKLCVSQNGEGTQTTDNDVHSKPMPHRAQSMNTSKVFADRVREQNKHHDACY
jgi:hypothetical protein